MKNYIILFGLFLVLYSCNENIPSTTKRTSFKTVPFDSIKVVLEEVLTKDQKIRGLLYSVEFNSPEAQQYIHKMQLIDKENQKTVLEVLEKYGWLKKSDIGEKASDAIFYTIQHSNEELMEKYLLQLKELVLIKEANPIHACMMEDRLLMRKGKKQIFGTQITSSLRKTKEKIVWPVENPSEVDSIRKAMGFETTITEYAKKMEAIYNPSEELPNESAYNK